MVALFEEQVKKFPFSIAVIEGEYSITYRDLNKSANQLAHYLISRGVQSETIVTICVDRSVSLVVGMLAILKSGAAYCPLDPLYPVERLKYMLEDSGAQVILTQTKYLEQLPDTDAIIICLDDLPSVIELNSIENPGIEEKIDHLAYIMYTSGTSGTPKGVMIERQGIVNLVSNQSIIQIMPDYSMMHLANISFDISTFEIWGSLLNGCQLIVIDQLTANNVKEFRKIIRQNPNPCVILPTNAFEIMIETVSDLFKGCRFVIFGGEICNAVKIKNYVNQKNQENLPDKIYNGYGPTEATTFVTLYEISKPEDHNIIPIGKPIENLSIELLDKSKKIVSRGSIGEICISGIGLARGYLNRSALNQERFSEIEGRRYYQTGDLGKILPDGNIEYIGREDNQIKIKGYRIELEEIEATLWAISDVESAVAKVETNAEGEKYLAAYLTIHKHLIRIKYEGVCEIKWQDNTSQLVEIVDVSQRGACLKNVKRFSRNHELISLKLPSLDTNLVMMGEIAWQSEGLVGVHFLESYEPLDAYIDSYYQRKYNIIPQRRNWRTLLERKLPKYMVPEKVIVLSSLPRTENGKIDRPLLDKLNVEHTDDSVMQITESEEVLLQLWREVLSIPKIKPTDNFFSLGGDSLLVTKVIAKLKEQYNINITYDQFFSNPSLSKLSTLIGSQIEASHFNPIPIYPRSQKLSLSISQKRIWFLSYLFVGLPLFNYTKSIYVNKKYDIDILNEALKRLIKRQEILETCFSINENGEPFQRRNKFDTLPLESVTNILELEDDLYKKIKDIEKEGNAFIFDLTLSPLFKIVLFNLPHEKSIFIVTFHKIISDEYSFEILMNEWFEIYNSIIEERESNLSTLTIQYSDFSAWELNHYSELSEKQNELIEFWTSYLQGAPPQLELPYDFERPMEPSFSANSYHFEVDEKTLTALQKLSTNLACTLNMTLFSSFICLIYVLTGKRDIVLGMPILNRNQTECENIIGPYENIIPVRTSFSSSATIHELINEVKFNLLNCYQYHEYRFEKIIERLDISPQFNRHPLFQMIFSFQRRADNKEGELDKAKYSVESLVTDHSFFDFVLKLEEDQNKIKAVIQYSDQLYANDTIEHWTNLWVNILLLITANPNSSLHDLSTLSLHTHEKIKQTKFQKKQIYLEYVHEPQSKIEKIIFKIWSDLLKRTDISVSDSFFEVGGHSLLIIQVISRIKMATGILIPVRTFFEHPTIRDLANYIEHEPGERKREIKHHPYPAEIPLSHAQERIWFLDKLIPHNPAYNIPFVFRISGKLLLPKLKSAIEKMASKYEILRTEFVTNFDGYPFQRIVPKLTIPFEIITSMDFPSDKVIENIIMQPFDLTKAPLFRVTIFKYSSEDFHFVITFHHIIADIWSMRTFFNELSLLYSSVSEDQPVIYPVIQYADYAISQREILDDRSDLIINGLKFWSNYLHDAPVIHECPLDYERPLVHRFQGNRVYFALSSEISKRIKNIALQVAGSDFIVLLSIFYILLNKISLQNDLVVATPVSGRSLTQIEKSIGFFINMLPIRATINSSATVLDFILSVKESVVKALEYQYVPFEKILSTINLKRTVNYEPLAQVLFVLQDNVEPDFNLPHLKIERDPFEFPVSKYDLMINLEEREGLYKGYFEYDSQLFSEDTVRKMKDRWLMLVHEAISNPRLPIYQLNLLSAEEEKRILVEWNDTQRDYDKQLTFYSLLDEQVRRSPQAIAIDFFNQSLTYSQLDSKVDLIAHAILSQVKPPGLRLGVLCELSDDLICTILAVMKIGGSFVVFDPELPAERLHYMMKDANIDYIITKDVYRSLIPQDYTSILSLDASVVSVLETNKQMAKVSETIGSIAYVIYTSGTTGKPKGVLIDFPSLLNRLLWWKENIPLEHNEIFINLFSFNFDAALGSLFWPLICGATILFPPQEILSNPEALTDLILQKNVSSLVGTPSLLNLILDDPRLQNSRLKKIAFAGEPLTKSVLEKARRIHNASIYNFYGPTECTIISSCAKILPSQDIITIGRPVSNVKIYILDHYLKPVPVGMIGEIYIGGLGVSSGYLSQNNLNELYFINNPFVLGEKLYRTGDLGLWRENGEIEFRGRIDTQVKIRGCRVELKEIECNLKSIPEVENAVVIYENGLLIAFVVSDLPVIDIRNVLSRFLPVYFLPDKIVSVSKIPFLPNGKFDRKSILSYSPIHEIMPPRTNTEKQLFSIFQEVLKREQFSLTDSFFDLGGYSLLITQTLAKIRKITNYNMTLQEFYLYPTIELLAKRIDSAFTPEIAYSQSILSLLEQDIHLGDSISVPIESSLGKTIFITGATGFLGRYMLKELLDSTQYTIYYLVQDNDSAKAKSDKLLREYNNKRLYPIIGNLNRPNLGIQPNIYELLSENISHIYHCGADISLTHSYQQIRQTNVTGSVEILKFAANRKLKRISFISTLSACFDTSETGKIVEDFPQTYPSGSEGGYVISKWVAEKIFESAITRGFDITIYRPTLLLESEQIGENDFENNQLFLFVKGALQSGYAPSEFSRIDGLPVDFVAKIITQIGLYESPTFRVYNLNHPNPISTDIIFDWLNELGTSIKMISYSKWKDEVLPRLPKDNAIYPLIPLYLSAHRKIDDLSEGAALAVNDHTLECIKSMLLQYPTLDINHFAFLIQNVLDSAKGS